MVFHLPAQAVGPALDKNLHTKFLGDSILRPLDIELVFEFGAAYVGAVSVLLCSVLLFCCVAVLLCCRATLLLCCGAVVLCHSAAVLWSCAAVLYN